MHRVRIRVQFRPITVRSAVPFRKSSYSCKIRNETQSFRSAVPEIIPTQEKACKNSRFQRQGGEHPWRLADEEDDRHLARLAPCWAGRAHRIARGLNQSRGLSHHSLPQWLFVGSRIWRDRCSNLLPVDVVSCAIRTDATSKVAVH